MQTIGIHRLRGAERRVAAVECRRDVHDAYNERIDAAHEKMVWTHPGMETYYRNDRGRVTVNYPWRNVDLFAATRRANLDDYVYDDIGRAVRAVARSYRLAYDAATAKPK